MYFETRDCGTPSKADVQKGYRKKALATHPDEGGSDAAFRAVDECRAVLERVATRSAGGTSRAGASGLASGSSGASSGITAGATSKVLKPSGLDSGSGGTGSMPTGTSGPRPGSVGAASRLARTSDSDSGSEGAPSKLVRAGSKPPSGGGGARTLAHSSAPSSAPLATQEVADTAAKSRGTAKREECCAMYYGTRECGTPSLAEVRRLYRKKALLAHPDKGGSDAKFRAVKECAEALAPETPHTSGNGGALTATAAVSYLP